MMRQSIHAKASVKIVSVVVAIVIFVMSWNVGLMNEKINTSLKNSKKQHGIPTVLHYTVFGDAQGYMYKTIDWSTKKLKQDGISVKVWSLEDFEREILPKQGENVLQAWSFIKNPTDVAAQYEKLKLTRMSDFARVLILYEVGGMYLDADTIPCRGLNFLLDEPTMASFASTQYASGQVLNFATSAPPHHPLFQKMIDMWAEMGPEIGYNGILAATGPEFIARSVDEYLKSIGLTDVPSISDRKFSGSHLDQTFVVNSVPWIELGDVRLAKTKAILDFAIIHIGFGSWLPVDLLSQSQGQVAKQSPCVKDLELIFPFLDEVCGEEIIYWAVFADCGKDTSNAS